MDDGTNLLLIRKFCFFNSLEVFTPLLFLCDDEGFIAFFEANVRRRNVIKNLK